MAYQRRDLHPFFPIGPLLLAAALFILAACPNPLDPGGDDPALSSDATLRALAVSAGALVPVFSPEVRDYSVRVANGVSSIQVAAATHHAGASLSIDGQPIASGAVSEAIDLEVGNPRAIPVKVTAENGSATRTYTVTVTRAAEDAREITRFAFLQDHNPGLGRDYEGVIDEPAGTVTVEVRAGEILDGLCPEIEITGASITPASGQAQDFVDGQAVEYTVSAVNGSQRVYEVTVNVLPMAVVQGTITLSAADAAAAGQGQVYLEPSMGGPQITTWLDWNADNRTATYRFEDVPEGSYSLLVFIDVDGDGMPNAGDYFDRVHEVEVSYTGAVTRNFLLPALAYATVRGTVTLPAPDAQAPGCPGYASIESESGDFYDRVGLSNWQGDQQADYLFDRSIPPGTYTVRIFIDMDGNSSLSDGDYGGEAAGIDVPALATVTRDIDLSLQSVAALTGTLTIPAADADGRMVELNLIPEEYGSASSMAVLPWETGFTQEFSIGSPEPGRYILRAFIDMDGSNDLSPGDYLGYYGGSGLFPPSAANLDVPASGSVGPVDIVLAEFPAADASVSGTVTLPSGGNPAGKHWMVIVGTHPGISGAFIFTDLMTWPASGRTASYTLPGLIPGNYYIWYILDLDGDGEPLTAGDCSGYYGGSGGHPPASANVTVTAGQSRAGIDIPAAAAAIGGTSP